MVTPASAFGIAGASDAVKPALPSALAASALANFDVEVSPGRSLPGRVQKGVGEKAASACAAAVVIAAAVWTLLPRHRGSAKRGRVSVAAFEEELGVQPPLGYWDPLGFAADGDYEEFYRRREAELKNGRVAMYATIGYIVPEYFRWPGYLSYSANLTFEKIPNGIKAFDVVPLEGWLQIIAWCGFFELCVNVPQNPQEPGNYYKGRYGVFWGRIIGDKTKRERALNVELANGRLAMVAILGMFFQNGVTGTTGPQMWLPGS